MNLDDIPLVRELHRAGTEDVLSDALMVLGPAIIACIALLGRTPVTTGLAGSYVGAVVLYVLYNGAKATRE